MKQVDCDSTQDYIDSTFYTKIEPRNFCSKSLDRPVIENMYIYILYKYNNYTSTTESNKRSKLI